MPSTGFTSAALPNPTPGTPSNIRTKPSKKNLPIPGLFTKITANKESKLSPKKMKKGSGLSSLVGQKSSVTKSQFFPIAKIFFGLLSKRFSLKIPKNLSLFEDPASKKTYLPRILTKNRFRNDMSFDKWSAFPLIIINRQSRNAKGPAKRTGLLSSPPQLGRKNYLLNYA